MDVFDALTSLAAARLRTSALAPFAQSYWDRLSEQRYSPRTARQYLNGLAHFAHWSRRRQFDVRALDRHITDFVDQHLARCSCIAPVQRSRHQVRAALQFLKVVVRASGVQIDDRDSGPVEAQLQRFDRHLRDTKGLAASTRRQRAAT